MNDSLGCHFIQVRYSLFILLFGFTFLGFCKYALDQRSHFDAPVAVANPSSLILTHTFDGGLVLWHGLFDSIYSPNFQRNQK